MNANPTTAHTIASGQRRIRPRVSTASPAPISPVAPHAAICHGVHGPWPKKKFDTSPASAPTTKPGPAPSAYPDTSTMSVVGLTFGSAANAIRPSAANAASVATSATIRASGRVRSYQPNPPSQGQPQDQERAELPAHAGTSLAAGPLAGTSLGAAPLAGARPRARASPSTIAAPSSGVSAP